MHQAVKVINKEALICLLLLVLSLYSCDSTKLYDEYANIPDEGWSLKDTVQFDLVIPEGELQAYDYLIGLRNNNDYLYANIFFYVIIKESNGLQITDTLQYLLAEPSGKWLGSGVGEIKHNLLIYKEQQMLRAGKYSVSIVHGMRDEVLQGIEDVGFRVERSN